MTKRFNELTNFMESVRALTAQASALQITSETIEHISALDPEFTQDVDSLLAIFTPTTATTTTEPEEVEEEVEPQPQVVVETAPAIAVPKEVPAAVEIEEPVVEDEKSVWKKHPDLEGVELHPDGSIRINGEEVKARMVSGYSKFYDPNTRKYYALASAMLTTFSGRTDNSMAPYYLDGNKENCALSNLRWATRDSSLTTSQVERACKIIATNTHLNESELLNILVRERTIKSVTALRSILTGNWRTISDRYFVVRRGSIIPTTSETTIATTSTTTTEPEVEVDDSGNLKGILGLTNDPAFVRKLYGERVDAKKVSADDQVALILSYIMDGKDKVQDIQKAIHKDFGRRVMISNAEIQRIIG